MTWDLSDWSFGEYAEYIYEEAYLTFFHYKGFCFHFLFSIWSQCSSNSLLVMVRLQGFIYHSVTWSWLHQITKCRKGRVMAADYVVCVVYVVYKSWIGSVLRPIMIVVCVGFGVLEKSFTNVQN